MTEKEYVLQLINNELNYWGELDEEGGGLVRALERAKRYIQDTTDNKIQEDFEKSKIINKALTSRITHLMQSEFIRSFDEKFVTGEYKRDIEEADKIALRKNLEFHYEHLDERPILTGDDARAFTKAFIDYLERRY